MESQLTRSILDWAKEQRIYARKIHGNAYQRRGIPDIHMTIKGRSVWFETKERGKKATDSQLAEIGAIRRSGGIAEVVYSLDQVKAIVLELLAASRPAT